MDLLIQDPNFEAQCPDSNLVAIFENDLAMQLRIVDVRAVRAAKISQSHSEIVNRKDTMVPTYLLTRRSQLTIFAATNQKTLLRQWN